MYSPISLKINKHPSNCHDVYGLLGSSHIGITFAENTSGWKYPLGSQSRHQSCESNAARLKKICYTFSYFSMNFIMVILAHTLSSYAIYYVYNYTSTILVNVSLNMAYDLWYCLAPITDIFKVKFEAAIDPTALSIVTKCAIGAVNLGSSLLVKITYVSFPSVRLPWSLLSSLHRHSRSNP